MDEAVRLVNTSNLQSNMDKLIKVCFIMKVRHDAVLGAPGALGTPTTRAVLTTSPHCVLLFLRWPGGGE